MSESKARKTTRIVVEIGGELKRVLAIHEQRDGRLILVIPSKGTSASLHGKQVPIEEYHYSIHLSNQSSTLAHLVHRTTVRCAADG